MPLPPCLRARSRSRIITTEDTEAQRTTNEEEIYDVYIVSVDSVHQVYLPAWSAILSGFSVPSVVKYPVGA